MHIFVVYTCYHMLYCEICREVEKNICCATCWFSAAVMLLFSFVCLSAFDQVFLCHGQVVVLFFFFFYYSFLSPFEHFHEVLERNMLSSSYPTTFSLFWRKCFLCIVG